VSSFFKKVLPANATLVSVKALSSNGTFGEGSADIPYPTNPTGLPELCAAIVQVTTSSSSSFRFGIFLPSPAIWNTKFQAVGNGGFAGGINWLDMGPGAGYGFATVSTDTGHSSSVIDITWALNQPEKRTDWGWRAMHGTVVIGKQITAAYYGKNITYSYYNGCSTGGRQGLKETQLFPDSFDGVLVGAPAWDTAHGNPWVTKAATYNLPATDPKHIPATLFQAVADEATRQCDAADGVTDGIISSPELCNFDFNQLLCGTAPAGACLTSAQIQTVKNAYSDWTAVKDGRYFAAGYTLSSEPQWSLYMGDKPSEFGIDYERFFLYNDPSVTYQQFSDQVALDAERLDPGNATANKFDLSEFSKRGGKLIIYHGLADGIVPTRNSERYYSQTVQTMGQTATDAFMRYFEIPGMQHCAFTVVDSPWAMGGASQASVFGTAGFSVPGFKDTAHDAVLALQQWVEKAVPVDSLIATTWKNSIDPTSGVLKQRPLCPYPQKAVFDNKGDVNSASSWSCKSTTSRSAMLLDLMGGFDKLAAAGLLKAATA
jgi:feruloyl esterase